MPGASNTTQLDLSDFEEPENPLTALQILKNQNLRQLTVFSWRTHGWEVKSRIHGLNLLLDALCQRYLKRGAVRNEDIVVYSTLLDALCDIGQVEDALEILGKIIMKGVKAPKRCRDRLDLSQCNNGEDMKPTKRLINEALIRGGVPRLGSYSAMAVDLYRKGKSTGQTCKVLDKTQERGYKDHHLGLMKRRSPHCEEKLWFCGGAAEDDLVSVDGVGSGLSDAGNSAIAVGYLKKTAKQYSSKCSCISVLSEASKVLEEMFIKSYWPPADTYNMLSRGLCSMRRQCKGVTWLEEMVSQDISYLNFLCGTPG
ncbi:hypothetical protein POTOM_046740 [Populus tomentosa]|uniref:Pentatricopeptide repeat-containing protein n=1 Tax=Populus tomentosa TaxID=118781 RepID=A0A8X8CBS9_POPTO|nr:hypothetical protein POTOM_046740 [Populus tomentosa]